MGHVFLSFDALLFATVSNWTSENAVRPRGEVIDELVRKAQLSAGTFVTLVRFVPVWCFKSVRARNIASLLSMNIPMLVSPNSGCSSFSRWVSRAVCTLPLFVAQQRCIGTWFIGGRNHHLKTWKECCKLERASHGVWLNYGLRTPNNQGAALKSLHLFLCATARRRQSREPAVELRT